MPRTHMAMTTLLSATAAPLRGTVCFARARGSSRAPCPLTPAATSRGDARAPVVVPSVVAPSSGCRGCRARVGARHAPVAPSAVSPAALFEVAVPSPPLVVIPPTAAFMTCILAVLVIALLGKDEHNMLLAQIALNAPYAVTTWWLGETGKMVCFGILALRTFFGAHLSGRLDALLNCGATLGLLIITAPSAAWVWRDTKWAAWINVGICVYRLATHTAAADGGEGGSRSAQAWIFFVAFVAKIALLLLSLAGIGLFSGYL